MRVCWTADYDMRGNGYGYTMHQKNLRAALERAGVEMSSDADIAVHIVTPPTFEPQPGKFNVLYTMYEMAALPREWIDPLNRADLIVVPNHHNKDLFRRYTKLPIEVVWEGVKPEKFTLKKRSAPASGEKFRFLWLGASNPRKGYEHVCIGWQRFLDEHPELLGKVELYLKTTQPNTETRNLHLAQAGAIFDNRDLPLDELIELYHSAHAFLFPSMGEGWGLTLHEAMATGLPAIYTPWSAMRDWVPEKYAYPLKFSMKQIDTLKQVGNDAGKIYHSAPAANPDTDHMVRLMYRVYKRYEEAAEKGYKAAQKVRQITWDRSAREFIDAVVPHYETQKREAMLEQYQDIWVKGKVEKRGVRDCGERWDIIRDFAARYNRPFTVLDIGANLGYFSLRLAEEFDCTVVSLEGIYGEWIKKVYERNENPRVILLQHVFSLEDLKTLAGVEHFDMVLALSVAHHIGPWDQTQRVLRELGDNVIVEMATEPNACNANYVSEAKVPEDARMLGEARTHLGGVRPIFVLQGEPARITKSYLGTPETDLDIDLRSDFDEKVAIQRGAEREWFRGINLKTFKLMWGAYPSKDRVIEMLNEERENFEGTHGDLKVHNVILQGDGVKFIDAGDHRRATYDDEKEFAKMVEELGA